MGKQRQLCFRDEIRKSLIFHALVPCFASLLMLLLLFTVFGSQQIIRKCRLMLGQFSADFELVITRYADKNRELAETLDVERFARQSSYRTAAVSDIYRFLNSQDYKGSYYLFDGERNSMFSTDGQANITEQVGNYLSWNTQEQGQSKSSCVFVYDNAMIDGRAIPAWLMAETIVRDGKIQGYSGFVLKSDALEGRFGDTDQPVLLANKFYRLFSDGTSRFQNDRGKLEVAFRGNRKLVHFSKRWYYTARTDVLNGEAFVQVVYDCTFFVQLCVIFLALVLFLGLSISMAIYRSAGNVADAKTEIIYDLIAALDRVEQGDLNVRLEISSGDEFQRIGYSFNTMIGSIRHLVDRHQELARENAQAAVQILESQFNPHFLFNTLESIRYMIKFGPDDAEKMLVSLSRMLRYSIQNGRDVVTVKDEVDFISRYLQIMLYRYGSRLKYSIDLEKESENASIPRMALQPIVENAIRHGFGEERECLEIKIRTEMKDHMISIVIEDDGVGIPGELLEKLAANLRHNQNTTDHIGIYNVHRRLRLIYGNGYGVTIESEAEKGTAVTLRIPCGDRDML